MLSDVSVMQNIFPQSTAVFSLEKNISYGAEY
jgi:hypothetical protein